jgi:hypothetical protein
MEGNISPPIFPGFIYGCLASLFLWNVAAADETPPSFRFGAGLDLSHGDYGSDQTTDSYSLPLTIDYSFNDNLGVTLSLPYMYQSNNALISLGGSRFPMQGPGHDTSAGSGSGGNPDGDGSMGGQDHMGPGSGSGGNSGSGPGGDSGSNPMGGSTDVPFSDESQNGPGDLALTVHYRLLTEGETSPGISTQFYVKFPIADEDKGLGTGAYDYGAGLSVGKWFSRWQLDAQVIYVMPGSTSSFDPDDYWEWSLTSSYLVNDQLNVGMGLAGATAPFSDTDDVLDLELQGSYWLSPRTSVGGFVSFGLSESSADYSAGVYGMFSF